MNVPSCPASSLMRMAISAVLDGEEPPVPRDELDAHLIACADCASWRDRARTMDRHVRQRQVRAPDLSRRIIGVVEAHICGCHTGGQCECTDCQCPTCTCRPEAAIG